MSSESSCSICSDWDASPEACRKRTEALRATIPADVLKRIVGRKVTCAGVSPAKFVGRTRNFKPPTTFEDAIYRVANASCLGIMCGFIDFLWGGHLKFESDAYAGYKPRKRSGTGKSDASERDRTRQDRKPRTTHTNPETQMEKPR